MKTLNLWIEKNTRKWKDLPWHGLVELWEKKTHSTKSNFQTQYNLNQNHNNFYRNKKNAEILVKLENTLDRICNPKEKRAILGGLPFQV